MKTLKSRVKSFSKQRSKDGEALTSSADLDKHQALAHRAAVAEGLASFAREFVLSLDSMLTMVNQFLEVVRSIDSGWLGSSESKAHVWAMSMGIKATAPAVNKELKKHLKSLEQVAAGSKAAQTILERRGRAQQERNHYLLKLHALRDEQADRERQGKSSNVDQLTRLARNEEKLAKAEQELDACNEAVEQALEIQLQRGQSMLVAALHNISQVIACGWFVSTGAVVCKALHQAENSDGAATSDAKSPGTAQATETAPPEPPPAASEGILVLPQSLVGECLEPPERFDPADPFGGQTAMPEPSGLDARRPSVPLESLSVRQLRECMQQHGLSDAGCIEKSDMITKIRKNTGSTYDVTDKAADDCLQELASPTAACAEPAMAPTFDAATSSNAPATSSTAVASSAAPATSSSVGSQDASSAADVDDVWGAFRQGGNLADNSPWPDIWPPAVGPWPGNTASSTAGAAPAPAAVRFSWQQASPWPSLTPSAGRPTAGDSAWPPSADSTPQAGSERLPEGSAWPGSPDSVFLAPRGPSADSISLPTPGLPSEESRPARTLSGDIADGPFARGAASSGNASPEAQAFPPWPQLGVSAPGSPSAAAPATARAA
mmetsp:Transcript_24010/g.44149  ORF Transcript_24010/g.44149 Transcript_24010/m.44149 type:complete len:607 (+) Transcript_24010:99-1919(+)